MQIIIDNDTGQILDEAVAKLPSRDARMAMAVRRAEVDKALDPRSAPQPGGPWVVGGWNDMTLTERLHAMTESKTGGAYAEAVEMQARGYAIGDSGG